MDYTTDTHKANANICFPRILGCAEYRTEETTVFLLHRVSLVHSFFFSGWGTVEQSPNTNSMSLWQVFHYRFYLTEEAFKIPVLVSRNFLQAFYLTRGTQHAQETKDTFLSKATHAFAPVAVVTADDNMKAIMCIMENYRKPG